MTTCRNCQQQIESLEANCPFCGFNPTGDNGLRDGADLPIGPRIAGGVLVANAVLSIAVMILAPHSVGPINPIAPALFDVVVGGYLMAGSKKALKWTVARVVLGLIVFSALAVARGDWLDVCGQVVLSTSLLLLLVGDPPKLRISAASVLLVFYFLAAAAGIQTLTTGSSMLTSLFAHNRYDLSRAPEGPVSGFAVPYQIGPLGDAWLVRDPQDAHRDNPLADIWLVNPRYDAHIMVIAETAQPGTQVDLSRYSDTTVAHLEKSLQNYQLSSRQSITVNGIPTQVVDVTGITMNMPVRFRLACYAYANIGLQVACFSNERNFSAFSDDCSAAIESLVIQSDTHTPKRAEIPLAAAHASQAQ